MKKMIFVGALALLTTLSFAATTNCPQFYFNGDAPSIENQKLTPKTKELCFEAYGVMHSGLSKTPLWSAEYLVRENLESKPSRKDVFHEESRLPKGERSELSDFVKSGMDRGHLSPSADFSTPTAQAESFSLANMIPQIHENNAGIWSDIESATRYLAKKEGSVYVITGPLFIGEHIRSIGSGVLVPTFIYKIVFSTKQNKGAAYITENAPGREYRVVSIKELESLAEINFFPKMSEIQKSDKLLLPEPKQQKH